ncbi:MAG: FkbM family methyltransferase, partial [Candidatus Cloacimonetes bacterium]|nr:FkbM family methyltransferase [Candidatus Cloacimonadota bacterium]
DRLSNKNQYLLKYRKDIASQNGEDGIIEKIFEIIPDHDKWCVEFGAWDGKHLSNTYNLIENHDWSGVLIEGNKKKCDQIKNNTYSGNDKVFVFNKFVKISGNDTLDDILSETKIPKNFDFLIIDIDGNDYHIFKSLVNYRPKLVIIEYNCAIPDNIEFVQAPNFKVRHGHSILSLTKLAKLKGYELICINGDNAFFIDKQYFDLFNIEDNSIRSLKHFNEPLQIFQLYDGTLIFYGYQCLHYQNIPMNFNKRFQMIPKFIRKAGLPWGDSGKIKRFFIKKILKLYSIIYKDKKIKSQLDYVSKHWVKYPTSDV